MALEMNDLMALKSLENGMTPYEQVKIGHMQSRRPSGVGIGGLAVGIGAAVVGVAGWIYAHGQAKKAQEVSAAKNDGLRDLLVSNANNTNATLDRISRSLERETDARVSGDITLNATINDTVSGSQQGQLSASQVATNEATAQIMSGLMTGRYEERPQRVALYRDATPCGCPATGCGCGN